MGCRSVDIDYDTTIPAGTPQFFTACPKECDKKISLRADSPNPEQPFDPWNNGLQVDVMIYNKCDGSWPPKPGVMEGTNATVTSNQDVCMHCPPDACDQAYLFRVTQNAAGVNPNLKIQICEEQCCCDK